MKRGSASRSCKIYVSDLNARQRIVGYLANVNEATHQILIAQSVHCSLSLIPGGIFHNPNARVSTRAGQVIGGRTYPHPYKTHGRPCPAPSITTSQQEAHKRNKPKPNIIVDPTFDIPFGSNKTSAKSTSPAAEEKVSKDTSNVLQWEGMSKRKRKSSRSGKALGAADEDNKEKPHRATTHLAA